MSRKNQALETPGAERTVGESVEQRIHAQLRPIKGVNGVGSLRTKMVILVVWISVGWLLGLTLGAIYLSSKVSGEVGGVLQGALPVAMAIVIVPAVIFGITGFRQSTGNIMDSIDRASAALRALAAGDLRERAEVDGTDELARMCATVNVARDSFAASVGQITRAVASIESTQSLIEADIHNIYEGNLGATHETGRISDVAEEMSQSVQTVAAGARTSRSSASDDIRPGPNAKAGPPRRTGLGVSAGTA